MSHMGQLTSGETGPLIPNTVSFPLYKALLKHGSNPQLFRSVGASLLPLGEALDSLEWFAGPFTVALIVPSGLALTITHCMLLVVYSFLDMT